jgi:hypothetical protein
MPHILAEAMAAMTLRLAVVQQRALDSFMQILRERGHLRERPR